MVSGSIGLIFFPQTKNRFFSGEREDHPEPCNSTPALHPKTCAEKQAAAGKPEICASSASDMDNNEKPLDEADKEGEGSSLDWLLLKERSEAVIPMDTNVSLRR